MNFLSPIIEYPDKACGSKKGPVKNRWTKPELVALSVSRGLIKSKANKMSLVKLCEFLGLRDSHHSSPRDSHHSSPRASRHSSPRASRNSSPVKRCGPVRGPNRYTKQELVAFAVSHGITKTKASKMTIAKLCTLMKSPSAYRASSPRASPRSSPKSKMCGPVRGPNRWTKPELVDYAVSLGMKKTHAKKMTLNDLCMNVVPSNVHVRMSSSPF
jgi:hypothetical protein